MRLCPECGLEVNREARLCPHCGAALPLSAETPPPAKPLDVWPPPPTDYSPPPPADPGPLLTKTVRGDVVLGFVAALVLCLGLPLLSAQIATLWGYYWVLWGGVLGPMILAYAYRNKLPSFARGAKYCAWAQGAIILGALALCFASVAGIGR